MKDRTDLTSIQLMLGDAWCCEWQDKIEICALGNRLAREPRLRKHWDLIRQLFRWWAPETYRRFAEHISFAWCGPGIRSLPWQVYRQLPPEANYSIGVRREAAKELKKAAKLLERALRSPAVDAKLIHSRLGMIGVETNRLLPKSRSRRLIQIPVTHLPLVANFSEDSVLSRLMRAIDEDRIVSHPLLVRKSGPHAREAYFAQCTARFMFYFKPNRRRFRRKIESFIADLIIVLRRWEGSEYIAYEGERVRQSLRRALESSVQTG